MNAPLEMLRRVARDMVATSELPLLLSRMQNLGISVNDGPT